MIIGIALLVIGIIFLLANLGIINIDPQFWDIFWPIFFIIIGTYIIIWSSRARRVRENWFWGRFFDYDDYRKKPKKDQ